MSNYSLLDTVSRKVKLEFETGVVKVCVRAYEIKALKMKKFITKIVIYLFKNDQWHPYPINAT